MKLMFLFVILMLNQSIFAGGGGSCFSDGSCSIEDSDYDLRVMDGANCSGPGFSIQIGELINAYNGRHLNYIYYRAELMDAQFFTEKYSFFARSLLKCENCESRFSTFDQSVAIVRSKYSEIDSGSWERHETFSLRFQLQDSSNNVISSSLVSKDGGRSFSLTNFYDQPITPNIYFCEGLVLTHK